MLSPQIERHADLRSAAFPRSPIALIAGRKMNRRAEILHELVRFEKPSYPLKCELGSFGFDWDGEPLLTLKKEHLLRIIERYLADQITAAQLQEWAENLEVREDVAFHEEERNLIEPVFFRIATPEIHEPLTHDSVQRMQVELTRKKGDPAGTDKSGASHLRA
jgi:hypothetical protein